MTSSSWWCPRRAACRMRIAAPRRCDTLGLRHQPRYIVTRSRPGTDLSEPMADLGGQVIGDIPDDEAVINAENAHRLIGLDESGPAAIALRRLARRVGSELRSAWPA